MKIFLSAGEASGDLHASNLIRALRQNDPSIECVGFGGPKMQEAGCCLLADLTELAVMFFTAALANLANFRKHLRQARKYFKENRVDAVVLIDYPGFNWWVARAAKSQGIPVFYYGVPQMWAWAPWRVRKLRRLVDHVLCKLPFETDWFRQRGVEATYVGHPFFDQLESQPYDVTFQAALRNSIRSPHLLLLPGSRDSEVKVHWPMLRESARLCLEAVPGLSVSVGCFRESHWREINSDIRIRGMPLTAFVHRTQDLMKVADVCLACSGSVSLELMYHGVPTIIVYKVSRLMFGLQSILLRCRYITLVNLLAADEIERLGWRAFDPDAPTAEAVPMPEYLTSGDRTAAISRRAISLLANPVLRRENGAWLHLLRERFGQPGASGRAADYLLNTILGSAFVDAGRSPKAA